MHKESAFTVFLFKINTKKGEYAMMEQEELLTVDELAKRWKVTKGNIYRLTRDKTANSIPRRKCGGKNIRFFFSEVDEWSKQRARAAH